MKTQMTKKQFEAFFKENIERDIHNDLPALQMAWNNAIDSMVKNGQLHKRARDWGHPPRFYTKSERKNRMKTTPLTVNGRIYRCRRFRTEKNTNIFLEANPGWGFLAERSNFIYCAQTTDKGILKTGSHTSNP